MFMCFGSKKQVKNYNMEILLEYKFSVVLFFKEFLVNPSSSRIKKKICISKTINVSYKEEKRF